MHYTFYSYKFDIERATSAFREIYALMERELPDAFLSLVQINDSHVVLLGLNDNDEEFSESIDHITCEGESVHVDLELFMTLEAKHAQRLLEHAGTGQPVKILNESPSRLFPRPESDESDV